MLSAFRNQDVFTQGTDINKSRLLSRQADLSCQLLPSSSVTWSCQREGRALILKSLKIQNVLRPSNQFLAYKTMLWMSVVRTLAWCFHIMEMSSIHTGERTNNNILNPSAERSQTANIALHFTERPLTTVVTFFRRKLREFFIPSWMILNLRVLESTTPDRR